MTLRQLSAIFLVWLAVSVGTAAQTQLEISSCFNPLLQQKLDYTSDTRLAMAKLAQISASDYEASKHDVSLAGKYKVLSGSADYKDFDEKRSSYFSLNKLDINYYRSISLSTRTLDSQAYGLIKDCIDKVASQQYGFRYLYTIDSPTAAAVQFFWNSTPGGPASLDITDSYVENAVVKSQRVPQEKLFPYVSRWSFSKYPQLQGISPIILLDRKDPSKDIRISVSTRPQVNTQFINLPPVPQPIVDIKCETVYDTEDPVTHRPYSRQEAINLAGRVTDRHGCSDCVGYSVAFDAPGPVTNLSCTPSGDHVWQEICQADGNHISTSGFLNSNPRSIYFAYSYKLARQDCKFSK